MYLQAEGLCFLLVSEVRLLPAASKQSKSLPALHSTQASLLQVTVQHLNLHEGGVVWNSTARTPPEPGVIFGLRWRPQMVLFV